MRHKNIGIGTGSWGKAHRQVYTGKCDFCAFRGDLLSYNTYRYVSSLRVPVMPLGRARVLDECPRCNGSRSVSLRAFRKGKRNILGPAVTAYQQATSKLAPGKAALELLIQYQDKDTFTKLSGNFEDTFIHDAEGLALLGKAYLYFGYIPAAEEAFRSARGIRKEDAFGRELAVVLMRLGRPEEALVYLRHILKVKDPSLLRYMRLLIESFQATGQHSEALKVVDDVQREFPKLAAAAWLREYRKSSDLLLGSQQRVYSISFPDPNPSRDRGLRQQSDRAALVAT